MQVRRHYRPPNNQNYEIHKSKKQQLWQL
uniref:Uncharacterized protein n=1 Tax=Arundo donax TaxID=35708 RepID=A0A0A8ZT43_ARUDO